MPYLNFITDDVIEREVKKVVDAMLAAKAEEEKNLHRNVIDPFAAIFDSVVLELSLDNWFEKEKARQVKKTIENKIGEFHQAILGSIDGWENLRTGKGIDICNQERKIIAEIKNKHNTLKASKKYVIYEHLKNALEQPEYQGFTAYYVEIIPSRKEPYDQVFTPSVPQEGRKPTNEQIRIISGQNFYELATQVPNALSLLFDALPTVISKVANVKKLSNQEKKKFKKLFDKAY